MSDAIIIVAIVAIIGGAAYYIYRQKKSGAKCVGCPYAKSCGGACTCSDKGGNKSNKNE